MPDITKDYITTILIENVPNKSVTKH